MLHNTLRDLFSSGFFSSCFFFQSVFSFKAFFSFNAFFSFFQDVFQDFFSSYIDDFLNQIGLTSHNERKTNKNGAFKGQMKILKKQNNKRIF
jgi:hypothetical protein